MKNNILLTIQNMAPQLSKKERLVADYILQHEKKLISMSVHEAANIIHVSVATIIRFCRSIGLNGYPDLKLALSAQTQSNEHTLYEEVVANDSLQSLQQKLTSRFTATLSLTNEIISEACIDEAVSLLEEAKQIVVFGLGTSHIAAEDFFKNILASEKNIITLSDLHVLTSLLLTNPAEKVLVLISNSDEKKDIVQLQAIANELSIKTIVITENNQSVIAINATVLLQYNTLEIKDCIQSATTTSLIAQLYVIDLLYYYILLKNYDALSKSISKKDEVIKGF